MTANRKHHDHLPRVSGCVYTYTDSKVSGYPGRRYPGKCEAFTRIQISGAVVRHACAMRNQHDLRPSFEGHSRLAARSRSLSGFSVIHESWKNLSSLFLSMSHVRNLAKLPIPVSICRKNIFDETGEKEWSKENRKQKLIEKLQIMSKLYSKQLTWFLFCHRKLDPKPIRISGYPVYTWRKRIETSGLSTFEIVFESLRIAYRNAPDSVHLTRVRGKRKAYPEPDIRMTRIRVNGASVSWFVGIKLSNYKKKCTILPTVEYFFACSQARVFFV